jgi:hypothetical protein
VTSTARLRTLRFTRSARHAGWDVWARGADGKPGRYLGAATPDGARWRALGRTGQPLTPRSHATRSDAALALLDHEGAAAG